MSARLRGRLVGALFLFAFVFYGFGSLMAGGDASSPPGWGRLAVGAALMLANSAIVVVIAVLARPMLRRWSARSADVYLAGRAFEALALAAGVIFLLRDQPAVNDDAYQIGMTAAGLAGLIFCAAALRVRLIARWLAVWGLVGYAIFTAGAAAELLGYGIGVALSVPGGLFEVALGIVLLVKGFPLDTDAALSVSDDLARRRVDRL